MPRLRIDRILSLSAVFVGGVFLMVPRAAGQTGGSITDGTTPGIVGAGSPAGSYSLSGFDTVNLFSGNLNVALPLLKVGGRGEAGYTMVLPIERRWRIETTWSNGSPIYSALTNDTPLSHWWSDVAPPAYSPGVLVGRYSKSSPTT